MTEAKLQKLAGKAIVVHPPTARILILQLEANERARRSTPEYKYDEWHVPGGSVEDEDNGSTEAAAVREVWDECQLRVQVIGWLGHASWSAYYEGQPADFEADFYLTITGDDQVDPPPVITGQENSAAAWALLEEFENYSGLTEEAHHYSQLGLQQLGVRRSQ